MVELSMIFKGFIKETKLELKNTNKNSKKRCGRKKEPLSNLSPIQYKNLLFFTNLLQSRKTRKYNGNSERKDDLKKTLNLIL